MEDPTREGRETAETLRVEERSHGPAHVLGAFQYPKSKTNRRGHAPRRHVTKGAPVPAEAEDPSCVEAADPGEPSHLALSPSSAR